MVCFGVLLVLIIGFFLNQHALYEAQEVQRDLSSLRILPQRFERDMVKDIDRPMKGYFWTTFKERALLPRGVEFQCSGLFQDGPYANEYPILMKVKLVPSFGYYSEGIVDGRHQIVEWLTRTDARARKKVLKVLPVVNRGGEVFRDFARTKAVLLSVIAPTPLLPSRGARWKAITGDTFEVRFRVAGQERVIYLRLDPFGSLVRAWAFSKSPYTKDKEAIWRMALVVKKEGKLKQLTVPTAFALLFGDSEDRMWPYLECDLEQIKML